MTINQTMKGVTNRHLVWLQSQIKEGVNYETERNKQNERPTSQ